VCGQKQGTSGVGYIIMLSRRMVDTVLAAAGDPTDQAEHLNERALDVEHPGFATVDQR
jgi:hypothetical protein